MKKFMMMMAAVAVMAAGAAETVVVLPPAKKSGGMTLNEALARRHTVRKFKAQELSSQQLSDLLWSANGVNRPDGKRTAPSARNRQEIMIYAALKDGAYFYDAAKHVLVKVSGRDLRKSCGRYTAPCYLILVPDKKKQASEKWGLVDAGYVSQNIYLAAEAGGMGTCAVGMIADAETLKKELGLGENAPVLVHPAGIPE